jgi:PPOX class probable F420-dependent enzyme
MTKDLDETRYISFTTYKRDGTAVSTPVWVVPFEDGYAFITGSASFKVKRIRNNASVKITASDIRGRVRPGAPEHAGTAELFVGDKVQAVEKLLRKKYRVAWFWLIEVAEVIRKLRRKPESVDVVVKILLSS